MGQMPPNIELQRRAYHISEINAINEADVLLVASPLSATDLVQADYSRSKDHDFLHSQNREFE
jgi:hypothetical protein